MTIYRAKESFAYASKEGYTRSVTIDDLVESGDRVKGLEHLYEPVESTVARKSGKEESKEEPKAEKPKVEEATAEPNAKRSVSTTARPVGRPPANKGDNK